MLAYLHFSCSRSSGRTPSLSCVYSGMTRWCADSVPLVLEANPANRLPHNSILDFSRQTPPLHKTIPARSWGTSVRPLTRQDKTASYSTGL